MHWPGHQHISQIAIFSSYPFETAGHFVLRSYILRSIQIHNSRFYFRVCCLHDIAQSRSEVLDSNCVAPSPALTESSFLPSIFGKAAPLRNDSSKINLLDNSWPPPTVLVMLLSERVPSVALPRYSSGSERSFDRETTECPLSLLLHLISAADLMNEGTPAGFRFGSLISWLESRPYLYPLEPT
mmetsp:Transcript_7931/g.16903  ORF Transcript_7931/g.16903 Transcript_7931/m.16903 type:complete len:184 (+) Transcript_7931:309-860(+)